MNRFFALFLICILLYACKPGLPADVIQPDKMEKILFDIHAVDGYIGTLSKPDTTKIVASSYYFGVYKKFDIDSATFEKSKNYYYTRPDLLDNMYKNIMKKFEKEKKRDEERLKEEALAVQRKEFAKANQVLLVPTHANTPPPFTMGENPFNLYTAPVQ